MPLFDRVRTCFTLGRAGFISFFFMTFLFSPPRFKRSQQPSQDFELYLKPPFCERPGARARRAKNPFFEFLWREGSYPVTYPASPSP